MNNLTNNTRRLLQLTSFILAWALLNNVYAEKVYESVDAEGEVTFSDTPPPAGEAARQIELQSGPAAAQVQESRQQEQKLEDMANETGGSETAAEPQTPPPATDYQESSSHAVEDEGDVYVEGDYADERYRDARAREGTAVREGYGDDRVREGTGMEMEERRAPGAAAHPAARAR